MITRRFQEILTNIKSHFEEQSDKELNEDLLKIFNYVIVMYSRNLFRYNSNWKRVERIYDFDYDYINENGVAQDLLNMQREYRRYAKLFDINKNNTKINQRDVESYRQFIKNSIKIMITKIVVPMNEKYGCIRHLIKKYEYLKIEAKKPVKSNRINYDALEQMFGRQFMIESGLLD
jgi:hypothetical protein